jgi:glucose-6-phosphate 1-epimerase
MSHSLPHINIRNERFQADILLQGAQLMHFQPSGQTPWIFQNAQTPFEPGREIYAGVPLVFPWFGRLKEHPDAPNHGFARQANWKLQYQSEDGSRVALTLSSADVREQGLDFPAFTGEFAARMIFSFGKSLGIRFEVLAYSPLSFECAFHPYFTVSDVRQTVVEGVPDGKPLNDESGKTVSGGAFAFPPYGAFLFTESHEDLTIREPQRSLRIVEQGGCRSTVIWNPGTEMEDLTEADWPHFICVEPGAVQKNAVSLNVDETYVLDVTIELN